MFIKESLLLAVVAGAEINPNSTSTIPASTMTTMNPIHNELIPSYPLVIDEAFLLPATISVLNTDNVVYISNSVLNQSPFQTSFLDLNAHLHHCVGYQQFWKRHLQFCQKIKFIQAVERRNHLPKTERSLARVYNTYPLPSWSFICPLKS